MRIEADDLQQAFKKAADELGCSITELDIKIIQHPSSGFLGMFKKQAIIEANIEEAKNTKKIEPVIKETIDSKEMNRIIEEVKNGVKLLIEKSCFDINEIIVQPYDDKTILIELNGEDAALLIGKEGYRYKAFSYLLYNWINIKYNLGIRLEIAKFLTNQELMMERYLIPLIEKIEQHGKGQTKPLDGVLIKIALENLRERFPDKYVGIKTSRDGGKYIVVNEFSKKIS